MRLHFLPKPDKDSSTLRDGRVDLETAVLGSSASPELRTQLLFRDRWVGVVRNTHPLAQGEVTLARFLACEHLDVARDAGRGRAGPLDAALTAIGQTRQVRTRVGGFGAALALVAASDLVACVPERHTATLRAGLVTFELPLALPALTISLLWHPRMEGDAAHRWLRQCVREVCAPAA